MIEIRISETGFVSGQAWETVGYQGDKQSRIIHTIYNTNLKDNYVAGYYIKSEILQKVVDVNLDENNNISIPEEFMIDSQKLWLQFYILSDECTVMKSNPFHLNIESSVGKDAEVILKPGADVFIAVNSIEDRNNIPRNKLANGKVVRVNNVDGKSIYYSWDNDNAEWVEEIFNPGIITINDVEGLVKALSWNNINEREDNDG